MATKSKPTSKVAIASASGDGIRDFDLSQTPELAAVCKVLRAEIDVALPQADAKIWHGAPVWFLEGYPVVGYSIKAKKAALLFWNGQALGEPMLKPMGKHFAAEILFSHVSELDVPAIQRCLAKAGKNVFKDYASFREGRGAKPHKQPSRAS